MRVLALSLTLLLALASCGGPPSGARPGKAPRDFHFVLANPVGLLALDANGQVLGQLAELPRDSAPATPSLFPDGRTIVFSITLPPTGANGFGSDLWTVGLDGSDPKPLVEHERDNVFYSSPLVDPSGNAVYFQRRAAIVRDGQYVGNEDSIERLDLRTKERARVASQAVDPALTPDGRTIVYVKWVDGQPQGLWRVGADGSGNKAFFTIKDTWWWLQAPRVSPDGRSLVFSAAGHSAKSLGATRGLAQGSHAPSRPGGLEASQSTGSARGGWVAHLGVPSELFLAPLEGTAVKSIAQTQDDVVPAWSPDGTHIAFVAAGSLQLVNVGDGSVKQLNRGDNFFFGDLLWVRR